MEPKRAAIYTRISRDSEGKELGIKRQLEDSRALAERLGFDVANVYSDNDVGASTRSRPKPRPQYEEMLRAARAGEFDAIIAYTTSRLTRRMAQTVELVALARDHGIQFHYVMSPSFDLNTAAGRQVAQILATNDEMESDVISERVSRAALQRAQAGQFHGNIGPFGFEPVKDPATGKVVDLQRHAVHADWLVEATDRLLAGETLYGICTSWNALGRRTRGRSNNKDGAHWSPKTLRGVLTNPALIGKRSHQGVLHDAVWEPIVNLQDWERVVALLSDPARKERGKNFGTARKYPLSGVLTCALCGSTLTSMTASRLRGHSFVCAKIPYNGCGKVRISHQPLEDYLREQVFARLDTPRLDPPVDNSAQVAENELHAELDKLGRQLARVKEGYVEGILSARDVKVEQSRIEKASAAAEEKLTELAAQHVSANIPRGERLRELWQTKDAVWKRQVLSSVIETVTVTTYPKGVTTNLTRRKTEAADEFDGRKRAHQLAVLEARVKVKWRA
ncbi:recombinase family protein [Rhodococcus sp. G-MC3]|uniref:recombinase family protein n=1 Tax=Rhodococcus sp. G-MC3 TaxID=3046209 RepID=UPI0024BA20F7|nr:recombinase family protein [Rhodococcus sp. G-MC3]MDJ0395454.1 recombinase family protein [Rhodococcus sp. G-MC3]